MVSPALPRIIPSGVSRHCSPCNTIHASGPGWVWMRLDMPGVNVASMNEAVCAPVDKS
jgi:hypothetical protein